MADKDWMRRCPPGGFGGRPDGDGGGFAGIDDRPDEDGSGPAGIDDMLGPDGGGLARPGLWRGPKPLSSADVLGQGRGPKAVSIDDELTPDAKALYFYFCAAAGRGDTASPGRDNTLASLGMGKARYRKALGLLTGQGYITAARGRSGGGFANSTYTLAAVPAKYRREPADPKKAEAYAKVRAYGIMALGCGTIRKVDMMDPRLTATAKAIYGYLASFAGADYPGIRETLRHLGVSEGTYYKHYRLLEEHHYITASKRLAGSRASLAVLSAVPGEGGPGAAPGDLEG